MHTIAIPSYFVTSPKFLESTSNIQKGLIEFPTVNSDWRILKLILNLVLFDKTIVFYIVFSKLSLSITLRF